uniref:THAP-type domain-containing protein n=1 Tax=Globodera rostochiensis TaxID=31243 RepID=A0A914HZY9_GLORO
MEKCIFCGSTRKSAPNLRFFGIPKEPGLKRIQWFYVLCDREVGPKDRVCAIHFRLGRPNSDPSHEDFVPHLHLNNDTPEYLDFLESLDECKMSTDTKSRKRPTKPSILKKKRARQQPQGIEERVQSQLASVAPKLLPIPNSVAESVGLRQGQAVLIRRYKTVQKPIF